MISQSLKISIRILFAVFCACFVPVSSAQTTVAPFLTPQWQFFDNSGNPLSNGKVCTFAAGTSTPLATYSESTGTTPNANPVILDSAGRATIFLTSASYKIVIAASTANSSCVPALVTTDNISWATPLTTFAALQATGDVTLQKSTAATGGANQSSNQLCIQGNYWTGAASATDKYCLQDTLGAGSNPTNTLALTHSGSSGASNVNIPTPLTVTGNLTATGGTNAIAAQNFNDILWVGAGGYANLAAAVAAAGSVNKTIIGIRSSYAGTDCGAAQDNLVYLDFRGMNPPCNANNSIHFNSATSTVPHMLIEPILFVNNPAAGSAITSGQFTTFSTGAQSGAGGLVDGFAATAATTGNISGTLGTLRGAELAALPNSVGGAVTNAEGVAAYIAGTSGATTTIGTAKGVSGIGCAGQTYSVAPTNCYGGYFWTQSTKATTRNYSAGFEGPVVVRFDPTASKSLIDGEDSGGVAHNMLYVDSGNTTVLQAVSAQPLEQRDNGATARTRVNANGTFVLPTACTITNANVAGAPIPLCGVTSQKSESAADTNVLTFTPPAVAGRYRIGFTMTVSAQNTATLGWTATWKDSNGQAQAPTNLELHTSGSATIATTVTGATNGVYYAEVPVDVDNSATAIVVKLTFSGTSFTAKVSATIERII